MNKDCRNTRKSIHNYFDTGKPLKKSELEHLLHCISCYSFKNNYEELTSAINNQINKQIDPLPESDFSIIKTGKSKKKNFIYKFAAVAAAVLVIAGTFLSYQLLNNFGKDLTLIDQNHIFVERLFNDPLFEIEYNDPIVPSDWFDVTGSDYDIVNKL